MLRMGALRATMYTPADTRKVNASHGRATRDDVLPLRACAKLMLRMGALRATMYKIRKMEYLI